MAPYAHMEKTAAQLSKQAREEHPAFSLNTASLFNQEAYSDLTIELDGRSIRCHKLVVCTKSKYFAGLCGPNSKFKVRCHSPSYLIV